LQSEEYPGLSNQQALHAMSMGLNTINSDMPSRQEAQNHMANTGKQMHAKALSLNNNIPRIKQQTPSQEQEPSYNQYQKSQNSFNQNTFDGRQSANNSMANMVQ
jgi:hypothetical protein